jgi:hydrogenase maturation protease
VSARRGASLPPRQRPVAVFACGQPDRGDDAAAAMAVARLPSEVLAAAEIHVCDVLEAETLASLPTGMGLVIVDAVVGPPPGHILHIDVADLDALSRTTAVASSHQLPLPRIIGLAQILRGAPLSGIFVGIGVAHVSPAAGLSAPVEASLPDLARAVAGAVSEVAQRISPGHRSTAALAASDRVDATMSVPAGSASAQS